MVRGLLWVSTEEALARCLRRGTVDARNYARQRCWLCGEVPDEGTGTGARGLEAVQLVEVGQLVGGFGAHEAIGAAKGAHRKRDSEK